MKMSTMKISTFGTIVAVIIGMIAAWTTHVVSTILASEYVLLIAGALAAPVGIVHGIGIWLGVW